MLDGERIVGIVDESDVLLDVRARRVALRATRCASVMSTRLETVAPDAPIDAAARDLRARARRRSSSRTGRFVGLITRIDVLNYLRRKLK